MIGLKMCFIVSMLVPRTFYYVATIYQFIKDNFYSQRQRYLKVYIKSIHAVVSIHLKSIMWSFFKQKKLPYKLRKGLILNLPKLSPPTIVQMRITFEILLHRTIFQLKLNPATQFKDLKQKLKIWKIQIVNVYFYKLVLQQYLAYFQ